MVTVRLSAQCLGLACSVGMEVSHLQSYKLATCFKKKSSRTNHPETRLDWDFRAQSANVANGICHFFIDQSLVVRRASLPVAGNLQRSALISHPVIPVAFSIERKVSFISYNLLCSLRLSIDFNVYLQTQQNGKGKESPKNKQTKQNIGPIGVFNSKLP